MSTNLGGRPGAADTATSPDGSCPTCGFVADSVTPGDAIAGLQSFPSAWRSALAIHLDDPDPEAVLTGRPAPMAWSALEHAGHVRDVLHALDIRLQRILREDEPVLPETHVTPPAGANEQGMAVVLAALTVSADQFAETIARVPSSGWGRAARRSGVTVTALDMIREAVHEGSCHLRMATDTLTELRTTAAQV
jgi:hypothetical protein